MPFDPRIEQWLDEWEARRQGKPSLSLEEFLGLVSNAVPADLLVILRDAIIELDRSNELLGRMKSLDRKCERLQRGPASEYPNNDP